MARDIRLSPGEEILRNAIPSAWWSGWLRYPFTLGLWEVWRRRHRFILTNQRVVVRKGLLNTTERNVLLGRVQDVSLQRSIVKGGWVELSSAGGALGVERIGPLSRDRARQFADAVSRALPAPGDGLGAA